MTLFSDPCVHPGFSEPKEIFYIDNLAWQETLKLNHGSCGKAYPFFVFSVPSATFVWLPLPLLIEETVNSHSLLTYCMSLMILWICIITLPHQFKNYWFYWQVFHSLRITFATWRNTDVFICMGFYHKNAFLNEPSALSGLCCPYQFPRPRYLLLYLCLLRNKRAVILFLCSMFFMSLF